MSIKVKDVIIGAGKPKVCAPIVEQSDDAIIAKLKELDQLDIDLIELRIDFYNNVTDCQQAYELFKNVKQLNINKPIILTYRSAGEGGQVELDGKAYLSLYQKAVEADAFDIYDVELSAGTNMIIELNGLIHGAGKYVLMSSHNFQRTPEIESLMQKFKVMDSFDADILKIAVMPEDLQDVINLLEFTLRANEEYPHRAIVTMAMSNLGVLSRLIGEQFGSAITFGCVDKTSAPGQINYQDLNQVLNIIHQYIDK